MSVQPALTHGAHQDPPSLVQIRQLNQQRMTKLGITPKCGDLSTYKVREKCELRTQVDKLQQKYLEKQNSQKKQKIIPQNSSLLQNSFLKQHIDCSSGLSVSSKQSCTSLYFNDPFKANCKSNLEQPAAQLQIKSTPQKEFDIAKNRTATFNFSFLPQNISDDQLKTKRITLQQRKQSLRQLQRVNKLRQDRLQDWKVTYSQWKARPEQQSQLRLQINSNIASKRKQQNIKQNKPNQKCRMAKAGTSQLAKPALKQTFNNKTVTEFEKPKANQQSQQLQIQTFLKHIDRQVELDRILRRHRHFVTNPSAQIRSAILQQLTGKGLKINSKKLKDILQLSPEEYDPLIERTQELSVTKLCQSYFKAQTYFQQNIKNSFSQNTVRWLLSFFPANPIQIQHLLKFFNRQGGRFWRTRDISLLARRMQNETGKIDNQRVKFILMDL